MFIRPIFWLLLATLSGSAVAYALYRMVHWTAAMVGFTVVFVAILWMGGLCTVAGESDRRYEGKHEQAS